MYSSRILETMIIFCSKVSILQNLQEKKLISDSVRICIESCIPSKGLNLDYLIDYAAYTRAVGVYLYNYDSRI